MDTWATSLARLRLAWWPIHPVIFVVLGSWGIARIGVSFLLGWAITSAVVRLGGAQAHRALIPLMAGVIAGELLMALAWMVVGWAHFLHTGQPPPSAYGVF